jgi:hypothetical protein
MSSIHISTEIVESQKARSELLKWKIIVVSILATVGFGISTTLSKLEWAFCLIPLVCAYVDALSLHLNLRIYSIGKWHTLDLGKGLDKEFEYMQHYEKFTSQAYKKGAYSLEKWTILYSSLLINIFIASMPYLELVELSIVNKEVVLLFGLFGFVITLFLNYYFKTTKEAVEKITCDDVMGD